MTFLKFPQGFLWGAATSAYQVEGGIQNNDWAKDFPAGRACDHYNLYERDFDLMEKLSQNGYRFSIEWSRIEPEPGRFDSREIEHYWKVLQALKSRDIKIMVTLHHFTNPLWLAKIGGWANKKVISHFSRFAERVFDEYRDLVDFWITINEPLVYAGEAYLDRAWPPKKMNPILFFKVIKNQIVAHKKVYKVFHKSKQDVKVGIAKHNVFFEPFNLKSPLDKSNESVARYFWNDYFLNKIKSHQDFIGLNYYRHFKLKFPFLRRNEMKVVSDMGWEVYPEGIFHVLKDLKEYGVPVYITENGLADKKDVLRKEFIKDHLYWIHRSIEQGVDVRGYFHWSLLDNFEWTQGFEPRFGLVEVDYDSLERRIRPSGLYFAKVSKDNQLTISN